MQPFLQQKGRTNVKVTYAPGGNSTLSLAWPSQNDIKPSQPQRSNAYEYENIRMQNERNIYNNYKIGHQFSENDQNNRFSYGNNKYGNYPIDRPQRERGNGYNYSQLQNRGLERVTDRSYQPPKMPYSNFQVPKIGGEYGYNQYSTNSQIHQSNEATKNLYDNSLAMNPYEKFSEMNSYPNTYNGQEAINQQISSLAARNNPNPQKSHSTPTYVMPQLYAPPALPNKLPNEDQLDLVMLRQRAAKEQGREFYGGGYREGGGREFVGGGREGKGNSSTKSILNPNGYNYVDNYRDSFRDNQREHYGGINGHNQYAKISSKQMYENYANNRENSMNQKQPYVSATQVSRSSIKIHNPPGGKTHFTLG